MDSAAQKLLSKVVAEWSGDGPLGDLTELVRTVWRTNVDRYEPRLGDDTTVLGIQSSRNLANLAAARLQGQAGVGVSNVRTLEVGFQGRMLHAGKVRSRSLSWDVMSVDWSESEVRTTSAEKNSAAYVSAEGTLFEDAAPLAGQPTDPKMLRELVLMWQGFQGGGTRTWVGFPRIGVSTWFAVTLIDDNRDGSGGLPLTTGTPVPPAPTFDALAEPALAVARKAIPRERPQQREA